MPSNFQSLAERLSIALACLLTIEPTQACSCAATPGPIQAAAEADLVFIGTVKSIQNIRSQQLVELAPSEIFVGDPNSSLFEIRTSRSGASCGFGFLDGQEYLVYANQSDGAYWTHSCSRTRFVPHAQEELPTLRSLVQSGAATTPTLFIYHDDLELTVVVIGGAGRRWNLQFSLDFENWTTLKIIEGAQLSAPLRNYPTHQKTLSFFRLQETSE